MTGTRLARWLRGAALLAGFISVVMASNMAGGTAFETNSASAKELRPQSTLVRQSVERLRASLAMAAANSRRGTSPSVSGALVATDKLLSAMKHRQGQAVEIHRLLARLASWGAKEERADGTSPGSDIGLPGPPQDCVNGPLLPRCCNVDFCSPQPPDECASGSKCSSALATADLAAQDVEGEATADDVLNTAAAYSADASDGATGLPTDTSTVTGATGTPSSADSGLFVEGATPAILQARADAVRSLLQTESFSAVSASLPAGAGFCGVKPDESFFSVGVVLFSSYKSETRCSEASLRHVDLKLNTEPAIYATTTRALLGVAPYVEEEGTEVSADGILVEPNTGSYRRRYKRTAAAGTLTLPSDAEWVKAAGHCVLLDSSVMTCYVRSASDRPKPGE